MPVIDVVLVIANFDGEGHQSEASTIGDNDRLLARVSELTAHQAKRIAGRNAEVLFGL